MTTAIATWGVRVTAAAVRDIAHEAKRAGGVRETGGWLFGHADRSGRITVASACATSPTARRDPGYVARSLEHAYRHAGLRGLPIAGGWHTHVDPVCDLSDTDRRNCAHWLDLLRDDYADDRLVFVEVIATRHRYRGWNEPDLTAHVFTDTSGSVIERAEIQR